jgi:hypothetical protein
MTEESKLFFDVGYRLGLAEKKAAALDRLLLEVLMGDTDPMQAMIDRQKIKDQFEEQA